MSDLLHRRILLDGAVYLRHHQPSEIDRPYVADLTDRIRDQIGQWVPVDPRPCAVVRLTDRQRPAHAPVTLQFLKGERQNGQQYFFWLDMRPGAQLYDFHARAERAAHFFARSP